MKISPSLGRETMVGRKSESLPSLFQGLIRHLGLSTSALRTQLGGTGLGFAPRSGERPVCSLPSCCLERFALSCEQACRVRRREACWQLQALRSQGRLRLAAGVAEGAGSPSARAPPPPAPSDVGKRVYFQRTCFPDPLASFHRSRCMRHHFMRLHRSPGAPFPSPFSLAHRDFIYLFITLRLSPGCLSSASA